MGTIHDLDLLLERLDRAVRKAHITAYRLRGASASLRRERTAAVTAYLRSTVRLFGQL